MAQRVRKTTLKPRTTPDDYDTPWKDAMMEFFELFIAFFFPLAHVQIDWSQREVFLDKELGEVAPDAVIGKLFVDKLVQVHLKDGGVDWICVHVEVQGQEQAKFAERMYIYCSRIFHRFGKPVASMAVLADSNPDWLPDQFSYRLLGCDLTLKFPVAKLLRHGGDIDALLADPNPFALLTAAHLLSLRTKNDGIRRLETKVMLTRLLYQRDWEEKRIISLFRVIDSMMRLPQELDKTFQTELVSLKEEKKMQYVTSLERLAADEARKEARKETEKEVSVNLLSRFLASRFGPMPDDVCGRIAKASVRQINLWVDRAGSATTLDDVFQKVGKHA